MITALLKSGSTTEHKMNKQTQKPTKGGLKMKPTRFLTVALVLLGLVATINAAGTPAGTTISNQAQGSYDDANGNEIAGATEGYLLSNTVTTTVSQVAGASLGADQAQNVSALSSVVYSVTFTNTGNGSDSFALSAGDDASQTGTFTYEIYHDVDGSGTINAGDTVATTTGALAADAEFALLIKVTDTTAGGAPEGDVIAVTLTALSDYDGGVSDFTVLTTTVQAATVTAVITADHDGDPQPGDVITYSICITNDGSAIAYNVVFTNLIPTNTTYSAGTIRTGTSGWDSGSGITDASDSPTDEGDYNVTTASTITVNLGDLAGSGGEICVYYKVTIDANVPEGDPVTNDPAVDFENEGGDAYPTVDPTNGGGGGGDITVSESFGVDIASTGTTSFTGDPGDSLFYAFTVENLGNGTDNFDLSSGSDYVVWTYYVDTDGDGSLSTAELAVGAVTNTGDLTQNQVGNFVAVGIIPAGTADTTADATTFTATSVGVGDSSETDTDTASATCTAPVLTLTKSVSPTGSQPPGTTLTYTITVANGGSGTASTVVVSDAIPTNTTYVDESMTIDSVSKTDASDSDGATDNGSSVVFEFSTLDESGGTTDSHTLTFQVTID